MSFFDYLAAGAAESIGSGLTSRAEEERKRNDQIELLKIKSQDKLDAQREAQFARADLQADRLAQTKAAGRSGGFNLYEEMLNADTPERQNRLVAMNKMLAGQDASDSTAEMYGRPRTEGRNITTGDFSRFDRQAAPDGTNTAPVPQSSMQAASFDRQKGSVALSRLLAIANDPSKLDAYSKGEAQLLRNDVTSNITLPGALKSGDRSVEGMNEALSPLNPKSGLEDDKNSLARERNAIRQQEADQKETRGQSSLDARTKDLLIKERKETAKAAGSLMAEPGEIAKSKARLAEIDSMLSAAPAAMPSSSGTPAPRRTPQKSAAAWKAGNNY